MDAFKIAWNSGELEDHLYSLKKRLDDFTREKVFLTNINSEVENAWKGIAGAVFDERMDVDIRNYESLLEDLNALAADLTNAIGKYEFCESGIKNEIKSLKNKVRR